MSRNKHYDDDEELSDNKHRRSRRTRRYSDEEDEDDERSSRRSRRSRYPSDEENEKTKKEKESKSTKTRRYSDEDDVSDDQSSRRRRKRNDGDDNRDEKRKQRSRRVEYSDDDDEHNRRRTKRRDERKNRRSRDDSYDDDYDDRRRSGRRSRRQDSYDDSPPRRSSRRSRKEYSEDDESPVRSSRKSRKNYSDEEMEDEKPKTTRKEKEDNPFDKYVDDKKDEEVEKEDVVEVPEEESFQSDNQDDGKEVEETVNTESKENSEDESIPNEAPNPFNKYVEDKESKKEEVEEEYEDKDNKENEEKEEQVEVKKVKPKNPFEKYTQNVEKKKKKEVPFERTNSVKKSSSGSVSIGKLTSSKSVSPSFDKKQNSIDKKQNSVDIADKQDPNKKRRREKDASSSILDVINWKMDNPDKYDGANTIPDTDIKLRESKDEDTNNTEEKETEQTEEKQETETSAQTVEKPAKEEKAEEKPDKVKRISVSSATISPTNMVASTPQVNGNTNEDNNDVFMNGDVSEVKKERKSERTTSNVSDADLQDSLKFLSSLPDISGFSKSSTLSNLMETYLDNDHLPGKTPPVTLTRPKLKSTSNIEDMEELERDLKEIREKNKKRAPPPVRNKPTMNTRSWEDPREHQRFKTKEKQWPPLEPPKDTGAYVVESYGQTDPLSKRLIKDIQRSKREEEEKKDAEKRAEVISENAKPVSYLRDTFNTKVPKPSPGVQKPDAFLTTEKSWIKHEKKPVEFDKPPDEPDWMKLIRNRRWKSTVKARFPCRPEDKTEFERRSTTPKNWKRLAKDKNALRMLSEIVGIGAEGEELFMRLASQRQKIEDEQEELDKLAEEELMAYQVARETMGEEAAYSLQMDNPLPAARMVPIMSTSSVPKDGSESDTESLESFKNRTVSASSAYPFTTSQLEAAYLTNQLLRLHPEEFRKLMSLERSRQATLRWQFSADPFDSVHEHQSLPLEIALLASEEPRITQAMKRILASGQQGDDSVFGTPVPSVRMGRVSRTRSDGGYSNSCYSESEYDADGYESSNSVSSVSSTSGGIKTTRGRQQKKKPVPPPTKPRCRSASPGMLKREQEQRQRNLSTKKSGSTLSVPGSNRGTNNQLDDDREVEAHNGLLTDEDLALSNEIAKLEQLTSNIGKDIDEELRSIESSLDDRKKGFFEDQIRRGNADNKANPSNDINLNEISSRREDFVRKDRESTQNINSNVRDALPKTRHKVRRISSSAQLDAVFRRRRQISESDMEDNDDNDDDDDDEKNKMEKVKKENKDATVEMTNLIKDINDTFGTNNN